MLLKRHKLLLLFLLHTGGAVFCASQPSPSLCADPLEKIGSGKTFLTQEQEVANLLEEIQKSRSIFMDPFLFMRDIASGRAIWQGLQEAFPLLPAVRAAVNLSHAEQTGIDSTLVQSVTRKTREVLEAHHQKKGDVTAIDGAYIALSKINEVFIRERSQQTESKNSQGNRNDETKKKEEQKEEKRKSKETDFPEPMDRYKPHNKDTQAKKEGQSTPVSIVEFNEPGIVYFKGEHFQLLGPEGWYKVPVMEARRVQHAGGATHELIVRSGRKKGVPLVLHIPLGYIPVEMENTQGKVEKQSDGNYTVTSFVDELHVPMMPQGRAVRPLSPLEMDIYTTPTGLSFERWPEWLQKDIELLKGEYENGRIGNLGVAKIIEQMVSTRFKYRVDKDDVKDIQAIVQRGAFQCDIATTLAASLLRDQFKIPARAVGGDLGHHNPRTPLSSHVIQPSTRHMWLEVPDEQGKWNGFDPTPKEKDRKVDEPEGKEENPFQPNTNSRNDEQKGKGKKTEEDSQREQGTSSQRNSHSDSAPQNEGETTGAKSTKELIDLVKKQLEKTRQKKEAASEEQDRKEVQDPSNESQGPVENAGKATVLKSKKEKTIDDIKFSNPLIKDFVKQVFKWALDESLDSSTKQQRLRLLKGAMGTHQMGGEAFQSAKNLVDEGLDLFEAEQPPFEQWINRIVQQAPKTTLNQTVHDLVKLQRQMEWTLKFKDPEERAPLENVLRALKDIRASVGRVKHPKSESIRIVEELIDSLPGNISRNILRNEAKYLGGIQTGLNEATLQLAKSITSKKDPLLQKMRLLSALGPHTDFLVDPVHLPSQGEQRTVLREVLPQRRPKSLMITNDPRDRRAGFIKLNPMLSDQTALRTGQMAVLAQNRYVKIPSGFKDTDPEKATILCVDTSGSMSGERIDFQAQYIAALVDRALSDVNPAGKAKHRVYIIPFSSTPREAIEVTSAEEAKALLLGTKRGYQVADGGTAIEAALLAAAKTVKQAGESTDKALARATVILTSDGGNTIHEKNVRDAFSDARRTKKHGANQDLQIKFGFVAIGGTNQSLVELANSSEKLGGEGKGMYIEFHDSSIQTILQAVESVPQPVNDFWTETKYSDAPIDIKASFGRLAAANQKYRLGLSKTYSSTGTQTLDWLVEASKRETEREDKRKGSAKSILRSFRDNLDVFGSYFSPQERAHILNGSLKKFKEIVKGEPETWDIAETAEIRHLIFWPETGLSENPNILEKKTE